MSDLTGKRFGRLVALRKAERGKWHCLCDCGNEADIYGGSLVNGDTKSCGCYRRDLHTTHGLSKSRLHGVWWGMIQRCEYNHHIDNKWYSSKGIAVCDEWRNDFGAFYKWANRNGYKEGMSLDRIDNSRGYSPSNCRFVSAKKQARNRSTNLTYTYNGETKCLMEWAEACGIKYSTLYGRIKRGWTFERAIKL